MAGLLNRAKMSTSTTGTGTVTLGSAVTGFLSFAEAGAVNATVYPYVIEDGDDFEIGIGTYTSSGTTFSRDTVTASKISGTAGTSKINLSGSATIFLTARAGDILNPANNLSDVAAAATAASNLGLGTGDSPQFTGINVGHATDTTVTRSSAGHIAVEGVDVVLETEVREVLSANRTYYVRANLGTVTMTIASPAVATLTSHGLSADDSIVFSTSGALPTGATIGTTYYVLSTDLSADTFKFSTSVGGSAVNTSGSQSGTHKLATGNDSNNGLAQTRAGALLSITQAMTLAAQIDFGGYTVTTQLADSYYSGTNITIPVTVGQSTADSFIINGNATTPANVVLNNATAWTGAINASTGARVRVKDLKLTGGTNTYGLQAIKGGNIDFSGIEFGVIGHAGLKAATGGILSSQGDCTLSGGAGEFAYAELNGIITLGNTFTLSGTPAFSNAFAFAVSGGVMVIQTTWSGSATGKRYTASDGGKIQTYGAGTTYLPGNVAGTGTNLGTSPYGSYQ